MKSRGRQSGYALLLTLLALLSLGGVVLTEFTQDAKKSTDRERSLHNQRVLAEAKRALLQYAYNYPVTSPAPGRGPGRLPCPDTDNDGQPESPFFCIDTGVALVGRLPWADDALGFYDARDADGERLWYAVSNNFAFTGPPQVNSSTVGSITIHDQSGNLLYDGNGAGVAAVIVAPGGIIERGGATQQRATGAQQIDPVNYLDLFGALDNADFVNDDSANGFVLGPIEDGATGSVLVNDQIVVITAQELIDMAEKRVLEAYREAILAYDERIDAGWGAGDHLPWLFNYQVNEVGDGYPELNDYPAEVNFNDEIANRLDNFGRVPSPYTEYFNGTDGQPIESRLGILLNLAYPIGTSVSFNPALTGGGATASDQFDSGGSHTFATVTSVPLTGVQFEDLGGGNARLVGVPSADDTLLQTRYFWDEEPVGDGWEVCPFSAGDETDCPTPSQTIKLDIRLRIPAAVDTSISFSDSNPDKILDDNDGFGNFRAGDRVVVSGSANNDGTYLVNSVAVDELELDVGESLIDESDGPTVRVGKLLEFENGYGTLPTTTIIARAESTGHARIQAFFTGGSIITTNLPVEYRYIYDFLYDLSFDNELEGTIDVASMVGGAGDSLALTIRYYPELPAWVFDNGWQDSVRMAYADDYRPDLLTGPCVAGTDCLVVNNIRGDNDDKVAILVIAGEHDWDDNLNDGLANDLDDIFDAGNDDLDDIFDAAAAGGNDTIMIIDEI